MVKSPTVVDCWHPEMDMTGRPLLAKFQVACPYSPYAMPHVIKVEVMLEEWQEVMEWKFGGKKPQEAWDQYSGKTWVPYSGIEIAGHEMELEMKCPFCGKEFDAFLRVPDWVINALPDELNPKANPYLALKFLGSEEPERDFVSDNLSALRSGYSCTF